jgi:hypothetical protein
MAGDDETLPPLPTISPSARSEAAFKTPRNGGLGDPLNGPSRPWASRPSAPARGSLMMQAPAKHRSHRKEMTVTEHAVSREDIIARNIAAVEAHFHNETPETVDKAIALYDDSEISWEGPSRGVALANHEVVRAAYLDIFKTVKISKSAVLRQFATEQFVFHDEVVEAEVVDELMPNLPYRPGTLMSIRLVHLFELRDGKIIKEIAYEMFRKAGSPEDHDAFPEGTAWTYYN